MPRLALYPGTFDPATHGHLDVLRRALKLFDHVEVTVAVNASKATLFTAEERVEMLRECVAEWGARGGPQVSVVEFQGLLVDHARARGAVALVRGMRQVSDFEYEFRMALANRRLHPAARDRLPHAERGARVHGGGARPGDPPLGGGRVVVRAGAGAAAAEK
jgi:pantetheine-phosphate adenylyltransferase